MLPIGIQATKASTLKYLYGKLQYSIIDDFLVFTVSEWKAKQRTILREIKRVFPNGQKIIVRSSANNEDSALASLAGYYHSEQEVISDNPNLIEAIKKVIASYSKNGRSPSNQDQIIVQYQVSPVLLSGVILTRDPRYKAPYYVINYDDATHRTDTVTSGAKSQVLRIGHWKKPEELPFPWRDLLVAVQEVESFFNWNPLNIEFGIDVGHHIHLFQARPLVSGVEPSLPYDSDTYPNVIDEFKTTLFELNFSSSSLLGNKTILTDMSDWNPAEIIGGRPNLLDFSLYRFLVTKSAWNEARISLGYTDVSPHELMVRLGDKPYIDARVSFNSLSPDNIPTELKARLINYYLDKLSKQPALQDKVEFQIVFTCFDLSFDNRATNLKTYGFSDQDIIILRECLLTFTNYLLMVSGEIIKNDLEAIQKLGSMSMPNRDIGIQDLLIQTKQLLINCKQLGVIPFSRLARLAFVGMTILRSLLDKKIISQYFFDGFQNSFETVAKQMSLDVRLLSQNVITNESFMSKYGHLRPGTYNIMALRYDQNDCLFRGSTLSEVQGESLDARFVPKPSTLSNIQKAIDKCGIQYSAIGLLDFIRQTVEYREYSKFEFTKSLSEALELIALVGTKLGFSRQELSFLDLDAVLEHDYVEFDLEYVKSVWRNAINQNRRKKSIYRRIALPPVVKEQSDFSIVSYHETSPNFITKKCVEAEVCVLDPTGNCSLEISRKIVMIEHADPGYDWVFTRNPIGLITKYGGIASHMAIRCAEFSLPAAIGCGEVIYDTLSLAHRISLDCMAEKIIPVTRRFVI